MEKNKKLLAYCGLYCADCAGHGGKIAVAARDLQMVVTRYKFERSAKSLFPKVFKDYAKFSKVLNFLVQLKCPAVCRVRKKGETRCRIRQCCIDRGYFACYECREFETCKKLKTLEDLHHDACVKNLRGIKKMGLATWLKKGRRYWFGSDVDA
jgi:hypothetical protein